MKYGIVIRNVADLRAEPKFRSERKSQLLYNDPVEICRGRDGYLSVVLEDGYKGWVDERAILILTRRKLQNLINSYNYLINVNVAPLYSSKDYSSVPFLFYGTRVAVADCRNNKSRFQTAIGETGIVAERNLREISAKIQKNLAARAIIKRADSFRGVPYLWGGSTPFGYDCSGLVQMIYQVEAGIRLPRDSKDQRQAGIRINREEVQAGDLRFFKGHVAIAIDKQKIIHSSLAGGGVVINSLHPGDSDYRPDLCDIYIEDRRVIL